jgi:hypothetical protein
MADEHSWAITLATEGVHVAADQVPVCWSVDCVCLSCDLCWYFCSVTVGNAFIVAALASREAHKTSARIADLTAQRQFRDAPSVKQACSCSECSV